MNIVRVYEHFPTNDDCIAHIEKVLWDKTPKCPYCNSDNSTTMPKEKRHHCNNCNTSYKVTTGTIFHNTHLPLQKWFHAIIIILNAKKGISARQLARDLNINKDSAWRMVIKIHQAMTQYAQRELLTRIVRTCETYIGIKPRKGNTNIDGVHKCGGGTKKIPVVGVASCKGRDKDESFKSKSLSKRNFSDLVPNHVDTRIVTLYKDVYKGNIKIKISMPHVTIVHTRWYVDGTVCTCTIGSFMALLKLGIVKQYQKICDRYFPEYINEYNYRCNHREECDLFGLTLQRTVR